MYSGTNSAILDPSSSDANPIEEVITKVLTAFGDLRVKLILGGNGGDAYVTIDSLTQLQISLVTLVTQTQKLKI